MALSRPKLTSDRLGSALPVCIGSKLDFFKTHLNSKRFPHIPTPNFYYLSKTECQEDGLRKVSDKAEIRTHMI